MVTVIDVSSGIGNLQSPIIIGCTLEVAEKFLVSMFVFSYLLLINIWVWSQA